MFRSRAEKAAITYVDVWDGFVDEAGRFAPQGPDYEGQTRRLRSGDGVYFTKFGARKLAHYVEREIQRHITNRAVPVALPIPVEPGAQPGAKPGAPAQRPTVGPAVPLTAVSVPAGAEPLMGAGAARDRRCPIRSRRACSPRASRSPLPPVAPTISAGRAETCRAWSRPRGGGSVPAAAPRPAGWQAGCGATTGGRKPPASADGHKLAAIAPRPPFAGPRPVRCRARRPLSDRCAARAERAPNCALISAAASSTPSETHRPRARTGGPRGSPRPPATGRGACRRPRTPSGSSCDSRACRP